MARNLPENGCQNTRIEKLNRAKRSERTIRSSVQEIMACGLTSGGEVRNAGENIQFAVAIVSHLKLSESSTGRDLHVALDNLSRCKDD